jgi:hypothetical protein
VNVQPGPASGTATLVSCADPCSQTVVLDTPLVPDAVDEVDAIIVGP